MEGVRRKTLPAAPVGVHNPDIGLAVLERGEDDAALRRPSDAVKALLIGLGRGESRGPTRVAARGDSLEARKTLHDDCDERAPVRRHAETRTVAILHIVRDAARLPRRVRDAPDLRGALPDALRGDEDERRAVGHPDDATLAPPPLRAEFFDRSGFRVNPDQPVLVTVGRDCAGDDGDCPPVGRPRRPPTLEPVLALQRGDQALAGAVFLRRHEPGLRVAFPAHEGEPLTVRRYGGRTLAVVD